MPDMGTIEDKNVRTRQNPPTTPCEKCGATTFEHNEYEDEYGCSKCGWIAKRNRTSDTRLFYGTQKALLGEKEWAFSLALDSVKLSNKNDSYIIPKNEARKQIKFCNERMWGYNVLVRHSRGKTKLVLPPDNLSLLLSWVNSEGATSLETIVANKKQQPKHSVLAWVFVGGFGTNRTGPGVNLTRVGQVALVIGAPSILKGFGETADPSKKQNLLFFLLFWVAVSLLMIWNGYQQYSTAYDKADTNTN